MIWAEIILGIIQALPELIKVFEAIFSHFHQQLPVVRAQRMAHLQTVLADWNAHRNGDTLKANLGAFTKAYGIEA